MPSNNSKPKILWLIGRPCSGKSTLAGRLKSAWIREGRRTILLDGDGFRRMLSSDLGFTLRDRMENLRRATVAAKRLTQQGCSVIAAFVTPTHAAQRLVKRLLPNAKFCYLSAPLASCEARDAKGMYRKARQKKLAHFTGITSPFEAPRKPDLVIDTAGNNIRESFKQLLAFSRLHLSYSR